MFIIVNHVCSLYSLKIYNEVIVYLSKVSALKYLLRYSNKSKCEMKGENFINGVIIIMIVLLLLNCGRSTVNSRK